MGGRGGRRGARCARPLRRPDPSVPGRALLEAQPGRGVPLCRWASRTQPAVGQCARRFPAARVYAFGMVDFLSSFRKFTASKGWAATATGPADAEGRWKSTRVATRSS